MRKFFTKKRKETAAESKSEAASALRESGESSIAEETAAESKSEAASALRASGESYFIEETDAIDEGVSEAESFPASSLGATGGSGSDSRVDSQLADAVRFKTEGNAFYKEKNVRSAIGRYHRALLVLRGLDSEVTSSLKGFGPQYPALTPEKEKLLRSTQTDCYNNLAACLLQREVVDYARVQEYSLKVLRWRAGDIKALYRAGVATLELGDLQTARQYLLQASRGIPNDANVKKQLQRVEERLSEEYEKEKALYKGMFNKQKQAEDEEAAENPSQV